MFDLSEIYNLILKMKAFSTGETIGLGDLNPFSCF